MAILETLVRDERVNAALGWTALGVLAAVAIAGALAGAILWAGFATVLFVVSALPAVATRDRTALVSWPLLAVGTGAIAVSTFTRDPRIAVYVSLAVLGLVVVAELDSYTEVALSRRFALVFALLTILALQGLWTVVGFYADLLLGSDVIGTQRALQWDFVAVALVGVVCISAYAAFVSRFRPVGVQQGTEGSR